MHGCQGIGLFRLDLVIHPKARTELTTPRNLTLADLEQCAVWEDVSRESGDFREARLRARPDLIVAADAESETGVFVVATDFSLADGSRVAGYCSPTPVAAATTRGWFRGLGLLQPTIAVERGQVPLWFDEEPSRSQVREDYGLLEREPDEVFPLEFRARAEPQSGELASGRIDGFCFARRPPFTSPFPLLNRTVLAWAAWARPLKRRVTVRVQPRPARKLPAERDRTR